MNHSTPGLPVHHQLPEFIQTHVHCVSDAIQPSHPLLPSSPWDSLVFKMVKNLPTVQETQVQSLGWEDLLEKAMTTRSSTLVWKEHVNTIPFQ